MPPIFTVIRDTTPAEAIPRGAVVAMGNFDGVHLGHRAVISAALEMGRTHGRPALALTFEPHPRRFFSPTTPQFRLSDEIAKLRLLAGTGLAGAVIMTFDRDGSAAISTCPLRVATSMGAFSTWVTSSMRLSCSR